MDLQPPPLPSQFPCWVRAVYSWGGENSHDLGFVEGDLIECLNAGDGSWWTGRLRRNGCIGSFPSNFVEILPPDFRPVSRSSSPNPSPQLSPADSPAASPPKSYRRPFAAYKEAPHYTTATAKQPENIRHVSPVRRHHHQQSPTRHEYDGGRGDLSRAPSPSPTRMYYNAGSRAPSPNPDAYGDPYAAPRSPNLRGRSPAPLVARSPAPMAMSPAQRGRSPDTMSRRSPAIHATVSRAISPQPSRGSSPFRPYRPDADEAPPPPPPPHRYTGRNNNSMTSFEDLCALSRQGSNTSYDEQQQYQQHSRQHSYQQQLQQRDDAAAGAGQTDSGYLTPTRMSPCPPSPGGSHMTPSPLREAMDGVIEQLDALGMSQPTESPDPATLDPWSPESFDMSSPRRRTMTAPARPQTAFSTMQSDEGYGTWSGTAATQQDPEPTPYERSRSRPGGHTRHLSNYVNRMQTRMHRMHERTDTSQSLPQQGVMVAPSPQPSPAPFARPKSSLAVGPHADSQPEQQKQQQLLLLRHRKSAYDVGRSVLNRTFTTKTNATTSTTTTSSSGRSLMSGASAGAFSATSAGSFARRMERGQDAMGGMQDEDRPETPFTGVTYHSSHASGPLPPVAAALPGSAPVQPPTRPKSQIGWQHHDEPEAGLGGLVHPKAPKRNIFKKIFDSARTGVASGRSNIMMGGGVDSGGRETPAGKVGLGDFSPPKWSSPLARSTPASGFAGGNTTAHSSAPSGVDWVQVRRDVNRSNSLSHIERSERRDRCQMLDYPVLNPVSELYGGLQGDEGADGLPVTQPCNYAAIQLGQVDKNTRFIAQLPPTTTTAITVATTYVCRPYRSDVQRLRAIFIWVSEKIHWEEDYEGVGGRVDTRRVLHTKRACAEEYAVLVMEMCAAVGIRCETVRGYLKTPGEMTECGILPRSNHWWNAVTVDGEWRMIDCCLASPTNPRRALYSSAGTTTADSWWFLTRPSELCWTHLAEHHSQQHMCPPAPHDVLLNLPSACAPFFRLGLEMVDFDSSLVRIEDLEMVHVKFNVPDDVEVAAEVEVRAFSRDADGDTYEIGDTVRKRALAQAEWYNGVKRYTVKALLPGDEGHGVLRVYAGKRGLMHSIKDIPHPLAFALPIIHTGENPAYEFFTRHPTPHAQRHDIYVVQPQCLRLALNNTFVFAVRQHPSSLAPNPIPENNASSPNISTTNPRAASPLPFLRPSSAMSMTAVSISSGSNPSTASGGGGGKKPAKLAIQTPGGKILRLMRKEDRRNGGGGGGINSLRGIGPDEEISDGSTWETIIKCSERGTWRGLVLADRTARWCVFAEWMCI